MAEFIDRTGETRIMYNGQKATIVAYRNIRDIDVQFENGSVVEHRQYGNFCDGKIKNPNFIKSKTGTWFTNDKKYDEDNNYER